MHFYRVVQRPPSVTIVEYNDGNVKLIEVGYTKHLESLSTETAKLV